MDWYVYMLLCGDNTLYTGMTDNVERRLATHRAGKGARYTRGRGPLELVYTERLPDRSSALKREAALKRLTRREKDLLRRDWTDQNAPAPREEAAGNGNTEKEDSHGSAKGHAGEV